MKYNKNKEFSEIKRTLLREKKEFLLSDEPKIWSGPQPVSMIFEPQFLSFWQDGTPDFYTNSIIGYAHKWYFTTAMQTLFFHDQ